MTKGALVAQKESSMEKGDWLDGLEKAAEKHRLVHHLGWLFIAILVSLPFALFSLITVTFFAWIVLGEFGAALSVASRITGGLILVVWVLGILKALSTLRSP